MLLEKGPIFGGTTAKSGGVYFIPGNRFEREKGLKEPREATIRDLARNAYPQLYRADAARFGLPEHEYSLLEALYDNGSPAVDGLDAMGALHSMPADVMVGPLPDYVDTSRGAPRASSTAGSGRGRPTAPSVSATRWCASCAPRSRAGNLPSSLGHRARRLITNARHEVVGLEAETQDGATVRLRARRGVVFASGGFTHNPELLRNFQPGPVHGGCAVPTNEGDFVPIALSVGAKLGDMQSAWRAQIVLEQALQFSSTPDDVFMPPGDSMIVVNRLGHARRQREGQLQRAHARALRLGLVSQGVDQRGPLHDLRPPDGGALRRPLPAAAGEATAPYVITADTLEKLGPAIDARLERLAPRIAGLRLDAALRRRLAESVRRFNRFANAGVDEDFHRGEQLYDREWHAKIWSFPNPGDLVAPRQAERHDVPDRGERAVPRDPPRIGHARHQRRPGDRRLGAGAGRDPIGRFPVSSAPATASRRRPPRATTPAAATLGAAVTFGSVAGKSAAAAPVKELA